MKETLRYYAYPSPTDVVREELTIRPKEMGFSQRLKAQLLYGLLILLADACYPNPRQFEREALNLKLDFFYKPEDVEKFRRSKVRSTKQIYLDQHFYSFSPVKITS